LHSMTDEELKPPSGAPTGGKLETTSSMPLEAAVLRTGSDKPTNEEPLGTMTEGSVTTGPSVGFGVAEVAKQLGPLKRQRSQQPSRLLGIRT
jgi:hypothetical protein